MAHKKKICKIKYNVGIPNYIGIIDIDRYHDILITSILSKCIMCIMFLKHNVFIDIFVSKKFCSFKNQLRLNHIRNFFLNSYSNIISRNINTLIHYKYCRLTKIIYELSTFLSNICVHYVSQDIEQFINVKIVYCYIIIMHINYKSKNLNVLVCYYKKISRTHYIILKNIHIKRS